MAAHPTPEGDRCAFPRNLTRGTYGGDVNCLQQHLFHQARSVDWRAARAGQACGALCWAAPALRLRGARLALTRRSHAVRAS
jgi:hypothetical protein